MAQGLVLTAASPASCRPSTPIWLANRGLADTHRFDPCDEPATVAMRLTKSPGTVGCTMPGRICMYFVWVGKSAR